MPEENQKNNRTKQNLKLIWNFYGGSKSVKESVYFRIAFIITLITFPLWLKPGWWDIVLGVLPNLLGFSLAGMAMLLAFGNIDFQKWIKKKGDQAFIEMSASYSIFIIAQVLAIIVSLIFKAFYSPVLDCIPSSVTEFLTEYARFIWGIGWLLFCYALMQLLAALEWIFSLTLIYDKYLKKTEEGSDKDSTP